MSIFDFLNGVELDSYWDIFKFKLDRFMGAIKTDKMLHREYKEVKFMKKICISFSNAIFSLIEKLKINIPDAHCNLEVIYFSIFTVCMAYYNVVNYGLAVPKRKTRDILVSFMNEMLCYIRYDYCNDINLIEFKSLSDKAISNMKEYEKKFPNNKNYIYDLLYVNLLDSGFHLDDCEYSKYENDNEAFNYEMNILFSNFYNECYDDFGIFK